MNWKSVMHCFADWVFLASHVHFTFYAIGSCTLSRFICDFYCMWHLSVFLTSASYVSPPHRVSCKALELYCFLGKMPRASVQELRGVGACRLKYLQWRHAMASFIRCLTSWTIKLSSTLNHKVKSWFFMTMLYSLFFFFLKGIMTQFEIAQTHSLIWCSSCALNWKTSHLFNKIFKFVALTRFHVAKGICKRYSKSYAWAPRVSLENKCWVFIQGVCYIISWPSS